MLQAAIVTDGHIDVIGIGYEGGELEPHTHVEFGTIDGVAAGEGEYEPGDLTFIVPGSTLTARPAGSQWDAIGIAAGQPFFFLPQSGTEADTLGSIFAGIGTEELAPDDWTSPISMTLTGATGPGEFALAQVLLGTPNFFMSTADGGITPADTYSQAADDHQHFYWYFTQAGDYSLTFDFSGIHVTDGPKSASATYDFHVIPEPSTGLLAALSLAGLILRRRRS